MMAKMQINNVPPLDKRIATVLNLIIKYSAAAVWGPSLIIMGMMGQCSAFLCISTLEDLRKMSLWLASLILLPLVTFVIYLLRRQGDYVKAIWSFVLCLAVILCFAGLTLSK